MPEHRETMQISRSCNGVSIYMKNRAATGTVLLTSASESSNKLRENFNIDMVIYVSLSNCKTHKLEAYNGLLGPFVAFTTEGKCNEWVYCPYQ